MEEAFQERLLRRKPGASIDMAEMETLLGLAGLSFDGA